MTATQPDGLGLLSPGPSTRFAANDVAGPSSASSATRPLATRVRSVLLQGPSDGKDIRRALDTLAEMYPAASSSSSGSSTQTAQRDTNLRRPPAKPPTSSSSDPLHLVDTARARRDLEGDIQSRMLNATDDIIRVLQTVDDGLVRLSSDVAAMHTSCNTVQDKLRAAEESSRYLVEHAEGLERQRAAALTQVEVANLFLSRFTLSEAERASIYSREVRVAQDLFGAMDKLQRIRSECQVLLQGSESAPASGSTASAGGGTRAGMDIMKSTADDLDQAYQKLYKWCSFEFRQPVKEGLEVSPSLREATSRLKHARQDLLRSALTTLVQTRSSILANAFMAALTMGAGPPTYLPGPIELHAHDPTRYVGDMLAWIHQTVASEREFLTALFDEKEGEGGRRTGQRRRGLEGSLDLTGSDPDSLRLGPGEALVREVLNSNLDGCCRPLNLRIQQTLRSQEGSVTSYRLAHLVQFYRSIMAKTIGSRASLSKTLGELSDLAVSAFADTVERQKRGIERYDGAPETDLSLPPPLVAGISTVKELMGEFSRSLPEDVPHSEPQPPTEPSKVAASLSNFDFVLINLVDPLIALVERMAGVHISKRPRSRSEEMARWEARIFTCNCLEALSSTLDKHPFASWKAGQLHSSLERTLGELTEEHAVNLLQRSGLATVLTAMKARKEGTKLSSVPGARGAEVLGALTTFEQCLAQEDLLTSRNLARLASPAARHRVHIAGLQRMTQSYRDIVEAVQDRTNGYEDGLVKTTPEHVGILLGL
ncbi:Conserved oligomeric Golgi complex subunit 6 [Kalmanozyma brasiliensis GHG001]|uniref:Conserved oligomeric Golgi complex subunit 6 n=1 Tax=Kalmanozyma brasiliensis (strain GHG001) TaxID=1365824 RepID=UPI001CE8E2B1|nr:Conserved oligomeric Golgi complex subunit 6 [Kalmanozyma brasiliensis GHG001]EST07420.2 Conserved oligomeric Golgi complex subunit 6 [Kalmanozyma brasiliensis GHG001]